MFFFFFSSRRRHTRFSRDWSSDVCSSDLVGGSDRPADALLIGERGARQKCSSGCQEFCGWCAGVSEPGAPEFEQVVGRGDQLPLGLTGGEAASEEAVAAPDHFRVRED